MNSVKILLCPMQGASHQVGKGDNQPSWPRMWWSFSQTVTWMKCMRCCRNICRMVPFWVQVEWIVPEGMQSGQHQQRHKDNIFSVVFFKSLKPTPVPKMTPKVGSTMEPNISPHIRFSWKPQHEDQKWKPFLGLILEPLKRKKNNPSHARSR